MRQELYGDVLHALDLPHFYLTETRYAGNTKLPRHKHSQSYLSVVIRGAYQELQEREAAHCATGSVIFHPSEEVHENIFDSTETICLNLHLAFNESSLDVDLRRRIHHPRGVSSALFSKIYQEVLDPDPLSFLILDGLGLALLGEVLRLDSNETNTPRWLKKIQQVIRSSFCEKLTVSSLASSAGVHPVHLSRSFHKYYGCTIGEYVRNLRVDFASRKLCTTNLELSEIALASGFADQSSFSKSFKRLTGYSPSQFRRRFHPR